MCKCTPSARTPYCGGPGCTWPEDIIDAKAGEPSMTYIKTELSGIEHLLWKLDIPVHALPVFRDVMRRLTELQIAVHMAVSKTEVVDKITTMNEGAAK